MQGLSSQSVQLRPRFRSFKYSISRKASEKKQELQSVGRGERHESIINAGKLDSVLKPRPPLSTQNQTATLSAKAEENIYVRTFTTFFTRPEGAEDEKENVRFRVLIPEYDHQFDEQASDFTFLDTMAKPVRFVETQLAAAEKELKRQRNDLEMLRAELQALRNSTSQRLEEIVGAVRGRVAHLTENLHSSEVLENQRKLRSRKEVRLLESGQELQWRMMESLKERNLDIQQRIFNCHPLELQYLQAPLEINENDYL